MARAQRRDPDKERFWRRMLRHWRRSGLSGRDFCGEHGLSEPSFYAWRRQIAERDRERSAGRAQRAARRQPQPAQPAFVRVALAAPVVEPTPPAALELVLAKGRVLRVGVGFDAELLRQLLRVLEEPPC